MTINEKVAYIKGLADGLELDAGKKEAKVIHAMLDLLQDMAESLTDCEDDIISMGDELDAISEDLTSLEDDVYDLDEDNEENEDDDEDNFDYGDEDDSFTFNCPQCGEELVLDEEVLASGSVVCEKCGKEISFELVDDGCDGNCEGCSGCDTLDDEEE